MMRLTFAAFLLLTQKTSAFVCDGERVIADSKVADDYCDCADGSDEAGKTGACPNTEFRCESKPHKATYIFASRVDDGICDCCDGTDERTSGVKCQNFCVELAKAELRTSSKASLLRVAREVKARRKRRAERRSSPMRADSSRRVRPSSRPRRPPRPMRSVWRRKGARIASAGWRRGKWRRRSRWSS